MEFEMIGCGGFRLGGVVGRIENVQKQIPMFDAHHADGMT